MTLPYSIKQHDNDPSLRATLTDGTGTAIDLTGAAVVFRMRARKGHKTVTGTCAIESALAGKVRYDWQPGDTDTAGLFRAELEATLGNGRVETIPNDGYIEVNVIADLDDPGPPSTPSPPPSILDGQGIVWDTPSNRWVAEDLATNAGLTAHEADASAHSALFAGKVGNSQVGVAGGVAAYDTTPATAVFPLAIGTFDGDPRVTHPSVLYFAAPWNGFHYWMAITPFPTDPRENPSIYCSNDGINWRTPAGMLNPLVPQSEVTSDGYTLSSDTALVLLPDGVTLACYYRLSTSTAEAIWRKTSTNGATWGGKVKVLEVTGEAVNATILSPAIVVEDNGTMTMWAINGTSALVTQRILRRTSADGGLTWSAPQTCTVPAGLPMEWHCEVRRFNGQYHLMLATHGPARLFYLISNDGITWTGGQPLPLTGTSSDQDGHYRSSFVVLPNGRVQAWVSLISSTTGDAFVGLTGIYDVNAQHRCGFFDRYFALGNPQPDVRPSTLLDGFDHPTGVPLDMRGGWLAHVTSHDYIITANGRIRQATTAAAGPVYYSTCAPATADYSVQADITFKSIAGGAGVFGRLDRDVVTGYLAKFDTNSWFLAKIVNGTFTTLGTFADTPTVGSTRHVELRMLGNQISMFIDGTLRVGPITDSAITAVGRAGVQFYTGGGSDTTGQHLDNFQVA